MSDKLIESANAIYSKQYIQSTYTYSSVITENQQDKLVVRTVEDKLHFRTERNIPKTGLLLIGLSGNNGTTLLGGILANKHKLEWKTKMGIMKPNWYGSFVLSTTVKLGLDIKTKQYTYTPLSSLLPFISPENLIIHGWDLNSESLDISMNKAQVFDINLQEKLCEKMKTIYPWPGVYLPDFIAPNQKDRVNNILKGSLEEQLVQLRQQIKQFKNENHLDKVIVLWTATTERFVQMTPGVHDTANNLLDAIKKGHTEVSPSILYATAAILEGCCFINGSPQNTFIPGIIELAEKHNVFIVGDDLKTGQTKLKSVLVEFLISAGLKPTSIVSYNHLGNNDGKNLSNPAQFQSKEISKSTVIDDLIQNNSILYPENSSVPDHAIVIRYVPFVGDSKRALDEYTSQIFMNGLNTLVIHNTCEDSLLAAPIILDLVLLTELFQRITVRKSSSFDYEKFHPVLSLLSYFCKAPLVPHGTPRVNGFNAQRSCLLNILLACLGLPADSHMGLEHKLVSFMK